MCIFQRDRGSYVSTKSLVNIPNSFKIISNYPNPFNPTTTILFSLGESNLNTTLRIYDISGRLVETLLNDKVQSGSFEFQWNATGQTTGVYFVELMNGSNRQVEKIILLK